MKKLALVFLAVIAAKIISHISVVSRPTIDLPFGKVELPIDGSINTWCAVKKTDCNTINYSKKIVI
jgi:hypothetical protein